MGGAKGSAIALAIDIVAGLLSGSKYAPDVRAIHYPEGEAGVGCGMLVLDIAHFMALEEYTAKMAAYLEKMRGVRRRKDVSEILLPGEKGQRKARQSASEGIDLPEEELAGLNQAISELGLEINLEGQ